MNMNVVGSDLLLGGGRIPSGVRTVEFDELLAMSDMISLHVPLTTETESLIDGESISRMRKGVC